MQSSHFARVCPERSGPSAIFAVCCSSGHTQECAQIRFMSPTHTLQYARCLRSCTRSSTDISITCNSLAKTSTAMQARPFSFRSADHFRVTILKAIGAVERLARLEEPVQFHHKPVVYILWFDRPSCKWTVKYIISCGKELHKFLYTYYQSCGCNHFQAHLLLKDVFIVHFVITCV